jgi:C4-type Zn-finger protein
MVKTENVKVKEEKSKGGILHNLKSYLPPCPECGGELEAKVDKGKSKNPNEIKIVMFAQCTKCGWKEKE